MSFHDIDALSKSTGRHLERPRKASLEVIRFIHATYWITLLSIWPDHSLGNNQFEYSNGN